MNKIWTIIKREYGSRVLRRRFILITLLTPLAFGLLFVVVGLIMSYSTDVERNILVSDPSGIVSDPPLELRNITFAYSDHSLDDIKADFNPESYNGILHVPPVEDLDRLDYTVYYYSDKGLDLQESDRIRSAVRKRIRDFKMLKLGLRAEELRKLEIDLSLDPEPLTPGKADSDQSPLRAGVAALIGIVLGFILYIMMFMNGNLIMRSTMEEKINRIVEIMVSTVKPFQLMFGKIIGVGAVGITQFLIWAILIPLIVTVVSAVFHIQPQDVMSGTGAGSDVDPDLLMMLQDFYGINWALIIPLVILFYIGGYLIYSSLFAAVGSAIGDDLGEAQSLLLPIMVPIILALYIAIVAVQAPNSSLAVISSFIPFLSPIVMPARLPFDPPTWQIIVSLVSLGLGVLLCVWVAARIYRVGILMYGKKATFREIGKWLVARG